MWKSLIISVFFVIIFFLGVLVGYTLNGKQPSTSPENLIPTEKPTQVGQSCLYNGTRYESGEGFEDADGCNSCSCMDGKVSCTLIACE